MATIWIIGDSTVEDQQPPFRGWGWGLRSLVQEGVAVRNLARCGRSSRSFREEGLFAEAETGMQEGDVLLIQFGHNDELAADDVHTEPHTTFRQELNRYCDAAIRRGALPVLVTPVSRRYFLPGCDAELLHTHGEYPLAVRKLAAARDLPLVDLHGMSRRLFRDLGEEETAALFVRLKPGEYPQFPEGRDDQTHFNPTGAQRMAELVAEGLRADERTRRLVR